MCLRFQIVQLVSNPHQNKICGLKTQSIASWNQFRSYMIYNVLKGQMTWTMTLVMWSWPQTFTKPFSINSGPWKNLISIKYSTKSVYIMQKYGFCFIQVAAILNVLKMAARGGGGGGFEVLPSKNKFSWSKVFVGKEPNFYGVSVY